LEAVKESCKSCKNLPYSSVTNDLNAVSGCETLTLPSLSITAHWFDN